MLAIASGLLLAACGTDPAVVTISASSTRSDDTTIAPAPTVDTTRPPDVGSTAGGVETTEPPVSTEPTLPPIIEPELSVSIPFTDVIDADENKPARAHDEFVAVAFTDIERWWAESYPEVYGEPFSPLDGGVYAGYPERQTSIPGCGERRTDYADLQLYVAFYCELGDFMAYDDGDDELNSLLTPLAEEFGPAVMGVVLAHEYGHTIQARIGALDDFVATILTEQQADCFAGAWSGQAYRGESPLLRLGDSDIRAGLLAMLSVRDPVGVDQFVPGGHGSAFDRVGAFQEGFLLGPGRCSELLDEPLPLMPNQFRSTEDLRRGGDASYDCSDDPNPDCSPATEFLEQDINHFWQTELGADFEPVDAIAVDDLDGYWCDDLVVLGSEVVACKQDRVLVYDEPQVLDLYRTFGDFTLGYFYGIGWAEFVQDEIGSSSAGESRALVSDCFTGAWVRDITPDALGNTPRQGDRDGDGVPDTVTSSPGDLDEAIRMAILVGDRGANVDVVGSPFEKIDAFRTGVLGGLAACDSLIG